MVLLLFGALAFVMCGIWFVLFPEAFEKYDPLLILSTGWISIIFFGICGWYIIVRLLDPRPGMILSDEGITDNSSLVEAGFIPWREIENIKYVESNGQRFLTFFVTNPEKTFRNKNLMQTFFMKLNQYMFLSPVQVSLANLKGSPKEIEMLIEQKWGKQIERSEPTL